jgi:hypothetical protein
LAHSCESNYKASVFQLSRDIRKLKYEFLIGTEENQITYRINCRGKEIRRIDNCLRRGEGITRLVSQLHSKEEIEFVKQKQIFQSKVSLVKNKERRAELKIKVTVKFTKLEEASA